MNHEPDPLFVEHLEWQLRSAARRQGRFARPTPSVPVRALRTAALVVFCLMGGASAVMAAEHLQDQERKQLLIAQLEIEMELAELRVQHVVVDLQRNDLFLAAGMIGPSTYEQVQEHLYAAESRIIGLSLDLEEVRASGREPRSDLAAPLVGGRDFVALRLDSGRGLVLRNLVLTADRFERLNGLAEQGLVPEQELAQGAVDLELMHQAVELLDQRLAIRARFVAGEIVVAQVDLLERLAAARSAVASQRLVLVALADQLEYSRELEEAGLASGEVRDLELELQLAEGELDLRGLELALLEQHGVGR